jgi:23S rRNA (cytosine1962-C5)-methyltransferase
MGQRDRGRATKERFQNKRVKSGDSGRQPNMGQTSRPKQLSTPRNGVIVEGGSERWLKRGFQWVYPNELLAKQNGLKPGKHVDIVSQSGENLGRGIWDDGWISVRRFLNKSAAIDQALFSDRITTARNLREQIIDEKTTAYRLVNAENDGLPGIRIDMFGAHALISLDSPSLLSILEDLTTALETVMDTRGVYLAWRPDPRDSFDPKTAPKPPGLISGHPHKGPLRVTERGVACLVDLHGDKSVGIFLDMRSNRAWLENHWGGKRILNLFAHTGFFSVVAAMHGASEVTSVDLSGHYLDRAEQNFIANELDPTPHSFIEGDVRKVLDRFRRKEERFDIAILDPPSFSHGPEGVLSLKKDFPTLVSSTLKVIQEGGWLVAALNLGEISPRDFHAMVHKGAQKAGFALQLIFEGGQGPDFPAHVDFPEGRYLKFGIWRKVEPV